MPKRKNNKKKKNRPRRNNDRTSLMKVYGPLSSSQSFQPRWMRCQMKYCDQSIAVIVAGGVLDQIYRANSMFDPDRTGVGHQPRGFDQLTPMYNRYRVNRLKWHIEFAGAATGYDACVALVNGAQAYTSIVDIGESNLRSPIKTSTPGGVTVKASGSSDLWRVQGRSETAYHTDDTTAAVVTTSPVETIDLHVFIFNPGVASIGVVYTVTLTYDCIFFDQIIPGQS
jgi:hypothetical protein